MLVNVALILEDRGQVKAKPTESNLYYSYSQSKLFGATATPKDITALMA